MREIKFRAWSDASKQMTDWGVLRGLHVGTAFAKSSNYHLMQFTGQLDKSGKEIYEGDVVARKGDYSKVEQIEFACDTFTVGGNPDHVGKYGWSPLIEVMSSDDDYDTVELLEVIGNIYENPELLA
jgi:uncharacterized phage protein (TIGR01671 family)